MSPKAKSDIIYHLINIEIKCDGIKFKNGDVAAIYKGKVYKLAQMADLKKFSVFFFVFYEYIRLLLKKIFKI